MKSTSKFLPAIIGVLILTTGYLLVYQFWYSSTPFGIVPVYDGKENLQDAERIINGETFEFPFMRVPLYPYILAFGERVNVFDLTLISLARWLNSIAVLLTTFLSAHLAWLIWKRVSAIWIAGILVGLNPVVVYFAADPLDISLATTCLVAGAWCLYKGYISRKDPIIFWLIGGIVLGIGMGIRAHLFLVAICWPVLAGLAALRNRRTRKLPSIIAAVLVGLIGPLLSFIGIGLVNQAFSGEFRMMPWGGSYVLWAGNGSLNNGRYYVPASREDFEHSFTHSLHADAAFQYQRMTGDAAPVNVSELSSYYWDEVVTMIMKEPGSWVKLLGRKLYILIHNYEQYEGKTYSLQKSISPYLSTNPIAWGILLTLATLGGGILAYSRKTSFLGILVLVVLYLLTILATFSASRYRVPLIPLLGILAGGVPKLYYRRDQFSKRGVVTMAFVCSIVIVLTFVPFAGIAEKDTYLNDYGLMADVAFQEGFDEEAIHWAQLAMVINSSRNHLKEISTLSRFRLWFNQEKPTPSESEARKQLEELELLNGKIPLLTFARGVYLWKLGDFANACIVWRYGVEQFGDQASIDALIWHCDLDLPLLESLPTKEWKRTLAIKTGDTSFKAAGQPRLSENDILAFSETYRIAFAPFLAE